MDSSRSDRRTREFPRLSPTATLLIVLVLITLVLYRETVASLLSLSTRTGNGYNHGLVLVGFSAFLLYRRWIEVMPFTQVRPSLSAALLVLLTSVAWLVAT